MQNLRGIMRYVSKKDWDWLLIADGKERSGKTNFMLSAMLAAYPDYQRAVETGDYKPILDMSALSLDELIDILQNIEGGMPVIYDEVQILGRRAMSKLNVRMVKVMTTVGMKNMLYLWGFQQFGMLDPYLRKRCRTRAYVHAKNLERGYVTWHVQHYSTTPDGNEIIRWIPIYTSTFRDISSNGKCYRELWDKWQERDKREKNRILGESG